MRLEAQRGRESVETATPNQALRAPGWETVLMRFALVAERGLLCGGSGGSNGQFELNGLREFDIVLLVRDEDAGVRAGNLTVQIDSRKRIRLIDAQGFLVPVDGNAGCVLARGDSGR